MDERLNDLKQKKRKLLYHFGEWLYQLFQTGDAELAFPSENSPQEKEIDKIFNMLNFVDERIQKFEKMDIHEEITEHHSGKKDEHGGNGKDHGTAQPFEGLLNTPNASGPDTLDESCLLFNRKQYSPEVETMNGAEANSDREREIAEPQEPLPRSLEDILENAQFEGESQERLFIENLEALQIGSDEERDRAFKNISYFSDRHTLRKVCLFMLNDSNPKMRAFALKTIGRTRDPKNLQHFGRGLRDKDAAVRVVSIRMLGVALLNAMESYRLLAPMLRDVDPNVRGAAVSAIGICGGADGVRAACQLWNDKSANVRKALLDMLAVMRMSDTVSVIKQLINDPDDAVRRAAENALSKLAAVSKKGKSENV